MTEVTTVKNTHSNYGQSVKDACKCAARKPEQCETPSSFSKAHAYSIELELNGGALPSLETGNDGSRYAQSATSISCRQQVNNNPPQGDVPFGSSVQRFLPRLNPTKAVRISIGWYTDAECMTPLNAKDADGDLKLWAKWLESR